MTFSLEWERKLLTRKKKGFVKQHRKKKFASGQWKTYATLEELYRDFDIDGNGVMNVSEFTKGLKACGIMIQDTDVQNIFQEISGESGECEMTYSNLFSFMKNQKASESPSVTNFRSLVAGLLLNDTMVGSQIKDPDKLMKRLIKIQELMMIMENIVYELENSDDMEVWENRLEIHREKVQFYHKKITEKITAEHELLKKQIKAMTANASSGGASPNVGEEVLLERIRVQKAEIKELRTTLRALRGDQKNVKARQDREADRIKKFFGRKSK